MTHNLSNLVSIAAGKPSMVDGWALSLRRVGIMYYPTRSTDGSFSELWVARDLAAEARRAIRSGEVLCASPFRVRSVDCLK